MKVSTVFLCAFFLLIIIFSTTLFAADATLGKQDQRKTYLNKTATLPSMIKINPADVNMVTSNIIDMYMAKAKAAGLKMKQDYEGVSYLLPLLENNIANYKNTMNNCKNKAYTAEDQKKVNCTDNMTIAQCSKLLFNDCMKAQSGYITFNQGQWASIQAALAADLKEMNDNFNLIYNSIQGLQK
jgi:hypothetical protein